MNEPTVVPDIEIRRHLLRMLMRHMPGAIATNLSMGICAALFTWNEMGDWRVWAWFVLLVMIVMPRSAWLRTAKRNIDECDAACVRRMELQAFFLLTANGLVWGNLVWLSDESTYHGPGIFVIGVLIGLTGASVTPLSSLRRVYPVYAVCTLGPMMLKFMLVGKVIQLSGAMGVALYLFMLITYSRISHDAFWNLFRLQLEKDGLITDLQTLDQSRSLFLAGVSHDLRQPVHALAMFANYLERMAEMQAGDLGIRLRLVSENSRKALSSISRQITRLLELSRLEAGEVKVKRQLIRIADLFETTQALHIGQATDKDVDLRFVPTRLSVNSDHTMLQSILGNLVSNAARYTQHGRVVVGVRRRGNEVELQVWDTGPGIAEAQIPLLFDAYRRFDDTTANQDGFGLGLALVKKQAELLGHEIIVRSQLGKGSMFGIRVPLETTARPQSAIRQS